MDDLWDFYDWFQKFEMRLVLSMLDTLPKSISKPLLRYCIPIFLTILFYMCCSLVIIKVLIKHRWPELLVIAGGIGTAISVLSPAAVARDHAGLLLGL